MRVVHITGKDFYGAGRAAFRLHEGLLDEGVNSCMLVGEKVSNESTVYNIQHSKWHKLKRKALVRIEKIVNKILGLQSDVMFSSGILALKQYKQINQLKPDLVHVHWINRGFFDVRCLKKIKAPIVISMHDMWYFTGGCHYNKQCEKYIWQCCECPLLKRDKMPDLTVKWQSIKQKAYQQINHLVFVGLSQWMAQCAQQSSLLKDHTVVNLPNCINVNQFKNDPKAFKSLGFTTDKKRILFAAVDALSDVNKGFEYLNHAITKLSPDEYELIILGDKSKQSFHHSIFKVYNVGFVDDDRLLIQYLSAAHLVVVPSLQENLSNMIMEALACSTPVVAFNTCGNGDLISHCENGYLAKAFDADDLASGIQWCLQTKQRQDMLAENAREKVLREFEMRKVSLRYMAMYKQMIEQYGG